MLVGVDQPGNSTFGLAESFLTLFNFDGLIARSLQATFEFVPKALGIPQQSTDIVPDRLVQNLLVQTAIMANGRAASAVTIGSQAAIVGVGPGFLHSSPTVGALTLLADE